MEDAETGIYFSEQESEKSLTKNPEHEFFYEDMKSALNGAPTILSNDGTSISRRANGAGTIKEPIMERIMESIKEPKIRKKRMLTGLCIESSISIGKEIAHKIVTVVLGAFFSFLPVIGKTIAEFVGDKLRDFVFKPMFAWLGEHMICPVVTKFYMFFTEGVFA